MIFLFEKYGYHQERTDLNQTVLGPSCLARFGPQTNKISGL